MGQQIETVEYLCVDGLRDFESTAPRTVFESLVKTVQVYELIRSSNRIAMFSYLKLCCWWEINWASFIFYPNPRPHKAYIQFE